MKIFDEFQSGIHRIDLPIKSSYWLIVNIWLVNKKCKSLWWKHFSKKILMKSKIEICLKLILLLSWPFFKKLYCICYFKRIIKYAARKSQTYHITQYINKINSIYFRNRNRYIINVLINCFVTVKLWAMLRHSDELTWNK